MNKNNWRETVGNVVDLHMDSPLSERSRGRLESRWCPPRNIGEILGNTNSRFVHVALPLSQLQVSFSSKVAQKQNKLRERERARKTHRTVIDFVCWWFMENETKIIIFFEKKEEKNWNKTKTYAHSRS